jgi:hypothetical protein
MREANLRGGLVAAGVVAGTSKVGATPPLKVLVDIPDRSPVQSLLSIVLAL